MVDEDRPPRDTVQLQAPTVQETVSSEGDWDGKGREILPCEDSWRERSCPGSVPACLVVSRGLPRAEGAAVACRNQSSELGPPSLSCTKSYLSSECGRTRPWVDPSKLRKGCLDGE